MGALREFFGIRPREALPSMMPVGQRSFVFPDMGQAQQFMASVSSFRVAYGNDLLAYLRSSYFAEQFRGVLYRSTTGRETSTYGYAPLIYRNDREYLLDRDPTAAMLIEDAWKMVWNGLPITNVPDIDDYFATQGALGLQNALIASYTEYFQEGGSLIYLEATGNPEEPLRRGDRPLSWIYIPAAHVISSVTGPFGYTLVPRDSPDALNPLLDHGIESIAFYPTEMSLSSNRPMKVHGSRIIPINLDPRRQKWWRTPHVPFHKLHDPLWELRDVMFARNRAQFQGSPIVVDVDLSADTQKIVQFEQMTEEDRNKMGSDVEKAIQAYNSGAKTTLSTVMAFKLRRLEAAQLPDPKADYSALASRLAHGSGIWPAEFLMAGPKGATVDDQGLLLLQGNVQNMRDLWGYKHLHKALMMGRIMGASSLRMQDDHDLPPPSQLTWQPVRPLSPRDAAFTQKTDATIVRELQEAGRMLPPRLQRMFPADPDYPIPPWMAVRGRDTIGRNTDVDPKGEPGGADPSPDGATPKAKPQPAPSPPSARLGLLAEDQVRNLIAEAFAEHLEPVLAAIQARNKAVPAEE